MPVALVGGASAPMPSAQVAAIWNKSVGAEAPPTRARSIQAVAQPQKRNASPRAGVPGTAIHEALTSSSAPRPARATPAAPDRPPA
ncbi:DUF6053 domain-containing protein [Lysobacter enzymogenes]|uniref:DUF6053 domain-containing protein n=1 Tax=Lysobacter enzymogenes TaxID=69 RepID=UPI003D188650